MPRQPETQIKPFQAAFSFIALSPRPPRQKIPRRLIRSFRPLRSSRATGDVLRRPHRIRSRAAIRQNRQQRCFPNRIIAAQHRRNLRIKRLLVRAQNIRQRRGNRPVGILQPCQQVGRNVAPSTPASAATASRSNLSRGGFITMFSIFRLPLSSFRLKSLQKRRGSLKPYISVFVGHPCPACG